MSLSSFFFLIYHFNLVHTLYNRLNSSYSFSQTSQYFKAKFQNISFIFMIIKNEIYIKSIIHPSPRYARIIKILASQEHVTKRDINFQAICIQLQSFYQVAKQLTIMMHMHIIMLLPLFKQIGSFRFQIGVKKKQSTVKFVIIYF